MIYFIMNILFRVGCYQEYLFKSKMISLKSPQQFVGFAVTLDKIYLNFNSVKNKKKI